MHESVHTYVWKSSCHFYRLHGVYQVTQSAFESCDLEEGVLQQWSRGTTDGVVSIALETSQTLYFIDSVPGQCQNGMKLSVSLVQHRHWCIPTIYTFYSLCPMAGSVWQWACCRMGPGSHIWWCDDIKWNFIAVQVAFRHLAQCGGAKKCAFYGAMWFHQQWQWTGEADLKTLSSPLQLSNL